MFASISRSQQMRNDQARIEQPHEVPVGASTSKRFEMLFRHLCFAKLERCPFEKRLNAQEEGLSLALDPIYERKSLENLNRRIVQEPADRAVKRSRTATRQRIHFCAMDSSGRAAGGIPSSKQGTLGPPHRPITCSTISPFSDVMPLSRRQRTGIGTITRVIPQNHCTLRVPITNRQPIQSQDEVMQQR
jgi:hypothetical protein